MNIFRKLYSRVELIVWIPLLILIIAATIEYGILFPAIRAFPGPICTTLGALIVIANMNFVTRTLTNSGFKDSVKRAWRRLLGRPNVVQCEEMYFDASANTYAELTSPINVDASLEQKVEMLITKLKEMEQKVSAHRNEFKEHLIALEEAGRQNNQERKEQIWTLEDKVRKAFLDGVQWQIFGVLLAVWGTCFNLIFPVIA